MIALIQRVYNKLKVHMDNYTVARAGKLDNLDTLISSRAPASTALSTATWTAARAAKLDSLDGMLGNKPGFMDSSISIAALDTWYTVGTVSGAGVLHQVRTYFLNGSNVVDVQSYKVRIIVDGLETIYGPVASIIIPRWLYADSTKKSFFMDNEIRFDSSLTVAVALTNTTLASALAEVAVDYSLI